MSEMSFAERLKFFRELNNMSMNQLAQAAGVTTTYLSKIERGVTPPPTWPIVEKLCRPLGIDPRPMVEKSIRERLNIGDKYDLYLFDHHAGGQSLYEVVTEREARLQELEIENRGLKKQLSAIKRAAGVGTKKRKAS